MRWKRREMGSHKNDSIYGAVYFMPIIERNRTSNNNNTTNNNKDEKKFSERNNKCGAKHSGEQTERIFLDGIVWTMNDLVSMSCDFQFFRF